MKKSFYRLRKPKRSYLLSTALVAVVALSLYSFTPLQQQPWIAPPEAAKVANPIAANAQSIAAGQIIYTKNCYDCHGKKGKGDGPKSADLEKGPKDFTKEQFQAQKDGVLFWKVTEGRKPMPSFKKDLTADQRWQVINYVRTLAIKK